MKNLIIIMFCALCLVGCKLGGDDSLKFGGGEEKEKDAAYVDFDISLNDPVFYPDTNDVNDVTVAVPPKYICEKCGKVSDTCYRIGTTEGVSDYCVYCMKELADKYLPKVKEIKEKT